MGFHSYKCAKSNISIPAYPHAGLPEAASHVILVTPDNEKFVGIYDGYGQVGTAEIYAKIALHLFGKEDRNLIWDGKIEVYKGKKLIAKINKKMWDEPLNIIDIIEGDTKSLDIIGKTMNELRLLDYKLESTFNKAEKLIKIVRFDHYNGENFEDLPVSKNDPTQGYFYDRKDVTKILKSLGGHKMNKKAMIDECVQYILDQSHERGDLVYRMKHESRRLKLDGLSIPEIRKALYECRENHIFYIAKCLAHGKRHANHAIRSCIAEAIESIR